MGILPYRVQQDAADQLHSTNKTNNYMHNVNKNCILLMIFCVCFCMSSSLFFTVCLSSGCALSQHPSSSSFSLHIIAECTKTTWVVCSERQNVYGYTIVNRTLCTSVILAWRTPIWFTLRVYVHKPRNCVHTTKTELRNGQNSSGECTVRAQFHLHHAN